MIYIYFIILTWLVWGVTGRPLPCTVVDEKNGAMLCCDYQQLPQGEVQLDQVSSSDKKCTLLTLKTSLGLFKEVWSMTNYTWAVKMLKTNLLRTKDIPRLKDCCCEEEFNFSISSHGISAQTGETLKIVQKDEYVQPILSLLCVKNDNCHNSGNVKLFQRMEAHTLYVESQDQPDYMYQELLLKPSGCLCVPHSQIVKPGDGEVLIPMNLIEEATNDSRIVKRNVEYPTELPEILRLALEIMREPNPLPVLKSVERQMALQLQQTRYLTAIAMAVGGFPYNHSLPYQQNQQGNMQTDMKSLRMFPINSYQVILSSFLAGLTAGQNFQNISQIEILDRLIVDNGGSGFNLLETILKLQNASLVNITNVDGNDTSSNETYDTLDTTDESYINTSNTEYITTASTGAALVDDVTDTVINPTFEGDVTPSAELVDGTTVSDDNTYSNEEYITNADSLVHMSFHKEYISNTASVTDSTNNTAVMVDSIADGLHTSFSEDTVTVEIIDRSNESVHTSSNEDNTIKVAAVDDSTVEPDDHTSSKEDYSTDATAVDDSTEEPVDDTSSNEDTTIKVASLVDGTDEPDDHISSKKDYSTDTTSVDDSTAEPVDHTSSNEDSTIEVAALVKGTEEPYDHSSSKKVTSTDATAVDDSTAEPVDHTSSNEDTTIKVAALVDGTEEADDHTSSKDDHSTYATAVNDSTAEPVDHSSSNEDTTIKVAALVDGTEEPDDHTFSKDDLSTYSTAVDDGTEVPDDHTSSKDDHSTYSTAVDDSTEESDDHTSSKEDYSTDSTTVDDSNAEPVDHTSSNEDTTIKVAALVDGTEEPDDHTSSKDDHSTYYTAVDDSTEESDDHTSSKDDYSTDSTAVDDSNAEPVDHTSSNEDTTIKVAALVDGTEEPDDHTSSKEDYSTDTTAVDDSTAELDHTSSNEDTTTKITIVFDSTAEPEFQTSSNEETTTKDSSMDDDIAETLVHTLSNEEVTTSPESEIVETAFNLTEYIMDLPHFKPLTIDPELLMHIMFASNSPPVDDIIDERGT